MRRFTVRPRPLQHQKKVRVYHLKNPDVLINENGDEVMINTVEDEGCVCSFPFFLTFSCSLSPVRSI